ncbi:unnamed protein product [Ilex paraguariensis]|uniref:Alcohol dehydrogenase-like 7 n=1 Tax=Ilex paraguariensis TaxID=185542 RepID=A0ABC8U9C5_9AQUA
MEVKQSSTTAGKPIRCRAAVARTAGEALTIEEVIVAPPKPYEVRIRIICTSLCQSDITFWKLKEPHGIFPRIFGHEAAGIVESVGEGIEEVTEGDIVIPTFLSDCGECVDCISKKSNQCSKYPFEISPWMHRDGTSRFTDLEGETLYHFAYVSSFSEYTVVDISHVTKIDPAMPPNKACLLSCGVSTGVGAAWRAANVEPGSTVVIFGLGAIGLGVAEGARLCGATRIIGVDVNPDKYEIGKKFGITDFVNSTSCANKSVSEVINGMTNGGADYCFECVGLTSLMEEAFACCRKGWGKTVILGLEKPGQQLSLNSLVVLHSGKTLFGTLFGGLKPKSDIPLLVKRYMDKVIENLT